MKATVGKSQALYSSISRRSKDKNSALLTIGAVVIEIPQHPVALHGMVTRSSKQLSSTLQVSTASIFMCNFSTFFNYTNLQNNMHIFLQTEERIFLNEFLLKLNF